MLSPGTFEEKKLGRFEGPQKEFWLMALTSFKKHDGGTGFLERDGCDSDSTEGPALPCRGFHAALFCYTSPSSSSRSQLLLRRWRRRFRTLCHELFHSLGPIKGGASTSLAVSFVVLLPLHAPRLSQFLVFRLS